MDSVPQPSDVPVGLSQPHVHMVHPYFHKIGSGDQITLKFWSTHAINSEYLENWN